MCFAPARDESRRLLLKGLASMVAAGATGRALAGADVNTSQAAPAHAATLDDRMPAFWRIYDATRSLSPTQRARSLVDGFFVPEGALYRRAGMRVPQAEAVARWLARFDDMAPSVRRLDGHLAEDLHLSAGKFRASLPDFDAAASPVFVLPSLFSFDAHLEPGGATLPLFFGPDGIVRYHGTGADLGVLFAHEIFHCYQAQRNPAMSLDPKPPVYVNLWIEGVATWASQQLNPGASLLHVLLDDETLLREGPRTAAHVASLLLERIDATDEAALESFFSAGSHGAGWPARAGYYVGWLAAGRIGRELTLREMAGLPAPQVRERLVAQLNAVRAGAVE